MKRALIISLNFHPGHVSHMVAGYKQLEELGYRCTYFVDAAFEGYLPQGGRVVTSKSRVPECDVAVFLFPSLHNIPLIRKLRKSHTGVFYIFHEPLASLKHYREAGFSYLSLAKLWVIDHVSALTLKWSDTVLLPSHKAVRYYKANRHYRNSNAHYMPLMFDDEATDMPDTPKRYISYIGTIAADHSFDDFVGFVETAVSQNWLEGYRFLIATKSDFTVPGWMMESGRVDVQKGRPLTDAEINSYYAATAVVWNAYARTTQSGVLAKAYMFGTPAIVLRKNLNEYMIDSVTVCSITSTASVTEIKKGMEAIIERLPEFSSACRDFFLTRFFYRQYNGEMKKLLTNITEPVQR